MKILPELLKSVEFGGGGPKVFGAILKIGTKLADDEYESRLIPVIIRLFASPDRAMRVCLLDSLPLMIDRIPQRVVNDKVFPNLVGQRLPLIKQILQLLTFKLGDRLCRHSSSGTRTDCEGSTHDRSQTFGSHHQWRALKTSGKDLQRRATWHSDEYDNLSWKDRAESRGKR